VWDAVAVFCGGGIGAALRFWMTGSVYRYTGTVLPYGTLIVNVLGSMMIGVLMGAFEERLAVQPLLRLFLTVGVLGGFTTFSTFSYETLMLFREGSLFLAGVNVLLSVVLCLGGCWAGYAAGRLL
jgi:CrcB protein